MTLILGGSHAFALPVTAFKYQGATHQDEAMGKLTIHGAA